jgi:hypothetical protein
VNTPNDVVAWRDNRQHRLEEAILLRGFAEPRSRAVDLRALGAWRLQLSRVVRGGKVVRLTYYLYRERALDDLGLSPEAAST